MNHPDVMQTLWALARDSQEEWLDFAQRLIRVPSLSGEEGGVAGLIVKEMEQLGYDRVSVDEVGNVIGLVRGGTGRSLMFNGHMDVVDAGPADRWAHAPYAAEIAEGCLWGRGASDMKASLALQVYSLGLLKRAGFALPGDCWVTAVVFEEKGGLGTRRLVQALKTDMAVVGEATGNGVARGHRGRLELVARFAGRSVHASVPERGVNPHYSVARFLSQIEQMPMAEEPFFGRSTVAPTIYQTDLVSANVTPGEVALFLDWRNVPTESAEQALGKVREVLARTVEPDCHSAVALNVSHVRTYTGLEAELERAFPSYSTAEDHWLVGRARDTLANLFDRDIPIHKWQFATDGAFLHNAGIPTIGFSPACDLYPHTTEDRIEVAAMVDGLAGYLALAVELGAG